MARVRLGSVLVLAAFVFAGAIAEAQPKGGGRKPPPKKPTPAKSAAPAAPATPPPPASSAPPPPPPPPAAETIPAAPVVDGPAPKTKRLAADVGADVPFGEMTDVGSFGVGAAAVGGLDLSAHVEATVRLGVTHHFGSDVTETGTIGTTPTLIKTEYSTDYFQLLVGGRYYFDPTKIGWYAGGELGANLLLVGITVKNAPLTVGATGGGTTSDTQTFVRLGARLQGGYILSAEVPLDLHVHMNVLTVTGLDGKGSSDTGPLIAFGLGVGYSFFRF